jgi:hypothetical protein
VQALGRESRNKLSRYDVLYSHFRSDPAEHPLATIKR